MKKECGFTLIEVLTVIAIIGIVAAIVFPVFASARERARQITCVSNIRQIGMSMLLYSQDNDDCYPKVQYAIDNDYYDWSNALYPYVKSGVLQTDATGALLSYGEGGIFACPSFPTQEPMEYGMNLDLGGSSGSPGTPQNTSVVQTPAETILVLEKGYTTNPNNSWPYFLTLQSVWCGPLGVDAAGDPPAGAVPSTVHLDLLADYDQPTVPQVTPPVPASPGVMPRYRHSGRCTVLFCDGHAKSMARGSIDWFTNIYVPFAYYQQDPEITLQ